MRWRGRRRRSERTIRRSFAQVKRSRGSFCRRELAPGHGPRARAFAGVTSHSPTASATSRASSARSSRLIAA